MRTLVDCGCTARAHGDGSGIEIDFCDVHQAASDLLTACRRALPYLKDHIGLTLDQGPGDRMAHDLVEAAIAKAEGR